MYFVFLPKELKWNFNLKFNLVDFSLTCFPKELDDIMLALRVGVWIEYWLDVFVDTLNHGEDRRAFFYILLIFVY